VLDALQKTFAGDEDGKTPGASDYRQMGSQALAQAIAAREALALRRLFCAIWRHQRYRVEAERRFYGER